MGTYAILKALRSYWSNPAYPMHRLESTQLPFLRIPHFLFSRTWLKRLAVLGTVLFSLTAAGILCTEPRGNPLWLLAMRMGALGSLLIFGLVALAVLVLSYLWPVVVAVRTSRAIATEREHRTWDTLLTLPYDRTELLLGKLSAALRGLNRYAGIVLWTQSFLILITFVLVNGFFLLYTDLTTTETLFALVLLALVMIEFAVVRVQDYVLTSLIGIFASLVAPTQQLSSVLALVVAIGMILIRALCTALPLIAAPVMFPNALLILATGPSSLIAMALPIPLAILVLLVIPLIRELIIRWTFGWLVRHLSDASLPV